MSDYRLVRKKASTNLSKGRGITLDGDTYEVSKGQALVTLNDVLSGDYASVPQPLDKTYVEIAESVTKGDALSSGTDGKFYVTSTGEWYSAIAMTDKTYSGTTYVEALIVNPSVLAASTLTATSNLSDMPSYTIANALEMLQINSGGTAYELIDPLTRFAPKYYYVELSRADATVNWTVDTDDDTVVSGNVVPSTNDVVITLDNTKIDIDGSTKIKRIDIKGGWGVTSSDNISWGEMKEGATEALVGNIKSALNGTANTVTLSFTSLAATPTAMTINADITDGGANTNYIRIEFYI